jgi:hypothetical protein
MPPIHEVYPMCGAHIFFQEAALTDLMLDGAMLLDEPYSPPRDARICTLRFHRRPARRRIGKTLSKY